MNYDTPRPAFRTDLLPTPLANPRITRLGPEMLGFELLLPNGITRAGWMTVPGSELSAASTTDATKVRWSWELWPWPRAFVARLVCQWERRAWRDAWGVETDWCRHPPGEPWLPQEPGGLVAGPHHLWRVERHEGSTRQDVAQLEPVGLGLASWVWTTLDRSHQSDWRAVYTFRAIEED